MANCDISKNIAEVRCFFKTGGLWSDGTKITPEDVLATYSLLAETDKNKRLLSSLSKFAITREGEAIVFRTSSASVENLEYLTIPIIKKSIAEQVRATKRMDEFVYSGEYIFEKRENNPAKLTESIDLASSGLSKKASYSRMILRFYADENTLLKNQEAVNLIYPDSSISLESSSHFIKREIQTPDFIGVFLNTARLSHEMRNVLVQIAQPVFSDAKKNPF